MVISPVEPTGVHRSPYVRYRTPDVTAQEYMQPITDSARGMVNTVYDGLLNGK